jgi:hypothetical protein
MVRDASQVQMAFAFISQLPRLGQQHLRDVRVELARLLQAL